MHLFPNDELLKKFVIVLGKHKAMLLLSWETQVNFGAF